MRSTRDAIKGRIEDPGIRLLLRERVTAGTRQRREIKRKKEHVNGFAFFDDVCNK